MEIHAKIDQHLLYRRFPLVQILLQDNTYLLQDPYYQILLFKLNHLSEIDNNQLLTPDNYGTIINSIRDNMNYTNRNEYIIDLETQKYQLIHFVDIDDSSIIEQLIFEFELSYESFKQYLDLGRTFNNKQLIRKCSYLETIYKLIQSPKQKNCYSFSTYNELMDWQSYFVDVSLEIQQNNEYYQILRKPLKELFRLSTIQLISLTEQIINIQQYLDNLYKILNNKVIHLFINSSLKIAVLYSMMKTIYPFIDQINQQQSYFTNYSNIIKILYPNIKISIIYNTNIDIFEFILFLMLQELDSRKDQIFNKTINDKVKHIQIDLPYVDQLYYYSAINFTQQNIKLNHQLKCLISHNIYSFVNLYCSKMDKNALKAKILEQFLISPFDDDILRMKMCIILFNQEDFVKLHQLVQQLLASDTIKDHEFRPVIISLCAMFTGIYLGKGEEALCFARLNYHDNLNSIVTPEILLAQIGYCYYNLGRSSKYLVEKNLFMAKAEEYFNKSLEQNGSNYLVHYNLGKLLAINGNLEKSMYHIDLACRLNNADLNSKLMKALLYQAQRENQTALKIVSSLIIIYPNKALLYLIKAAILTEIYLGNLQNDNELNAATQISTELREFIQKKYQKSKESQIIISTLKKALVGIIKQVQEIEQNEDSLSDLAHLKIMQNIEVDPLTYLNYRNSIFNALNILINLSLFELANQLLELIDDGNSTNRIEKLYYQGLIQEKQGNHVYAITIYEDVLKYDFYHVNTMSRLGCLYLKHFKEQKIQRASELLISASKFDKTYENFLGLGILNQIQGNVDESNEYFIEALKIIKTSPSISFQLVPDKLFM